MAGIVDEDHMENLMNAILVKDRVRPAMLLFQPLWLTQADDDPQGFR